MSFPSRAPLCLATDGHYSGQSSRFTCPGVNVYFTASVFFGTLGARRVFGKGAIYTTLLTAFPIGFFVPIIFYLFQRKLPRTHWIAKIHPVMLLNGASSWTAPVSLLRALHLSNSANTYKVQHRLLLARCHPWLAQYGVPSPALLGLLVQIQLRSLRSFLFWYGVLRADYLLCGKLQEFRGELVGQ